MSAQSEKQQALQNALNLSPPSHFTETRTWLGSLFFNIKNELNQKYSYLEFAGDLGFSPTNVVFLMIRGKRSLSQKSAQRICESLALPAKERNYLTLLAEFENTKPTHERERIFAELVKLRGKFELANLTRSQLRFFTEWYHSVIRELVGLPDFQANPEWIASNLRPRIRPRQAAESLSLLEELGLIQRHPVTHKFVQTEAHVTTGDEVNSLSIVRFHQQMLDLAKDSITTISEDERDVSAIQVPANAELMEKIKREVRSFRKQILSICAEHKNCDRVLQLNIQIFPVTDSRRKST